MKEYKAIFFDRDNTLTHAKEETKLLRNQLIEKWSGRKLELDYYRTMDLFKKSGYPQSGLKTVDEEVQFWKRYYKQLLKDEGIEEDKLDEKSELIFSKVWLKDRELFPDVLDVLEYLKNNNYKMGVISDTSPSLELTLTSLGIGRYFDCFICSDIVGVMKPDPKIYKTALDTLGVKAEESIYVDDYDYDKEADGARKLGFTSFHLCRNGELKDKWDIKSLSEIVDFLKDK
ncbi:HAD family hydrolase [Inconstantimicrobium porci]|nr:HAD family hydrolase [Inconstantimicrobium porci]